MPVTTAEFRFKLLRYLGVGYRWMTRLFALLCYAMLLLPGFLQGMMNVRLWPIITIFQAKYTEVLFMEINREIGRLDLYLPVNADGKKPTVIFVTGGAWIIGYKAWGSLLGKQLSERDIIVACIDYRNFLKGLSSNMIKDVSQGISFVCNKAATFGGDPDRVYLVGNQLVHNYQLVLCWSRQSESHEERAALGVSHR
ncbi:Isoprenylcysteine alpha-carbonyl methylesterase ICME [Bienertia sinuspersici]